MKGVGKRGEERSGAEQYLGVNAVKQKEVWDVADDPNLITIQKHDFACLIVGVVEVGLIVELVGIGDARGQVGR
jgi:hypothetical protein